jgi:hypothetical protein
MCSQFSHTADLLGWAAMGQYVSLNRELDAISVNMIAIVGGIAQLRHVFQMEARAVIAPLVAAVIVMVGFVVLQIRLIPTARAWLARPVPSIITAYVSPVPPA